MGDVNEQRFARSVEEHDPGLYDVRTAILETSHFRHSSWTDREKKIRSFIFWKFAAALHFAGEGIDGVEQIQEAHVVRMSEMLKVDNQWKSWVPSWTKKNIRYLAVFLGELRKDPLFAVGIRQDLRQNKVSPRLTEILRHAPHLKWIEEQFEIWIDQQNVLNKNRDGLRLLLTYLSRLPLDPARSELDMLSEPVLRPMLDYAKTWQTPTTRINAVSKIQAFAKSLADNISANARKKVELGLRDIDVQRFSKSNRP